MKIFTILTVTVLIFISGQLNAQFLIFGHNINESEEGSTSIQTDADGNLYQKGNFEGTKDFDPGEGVQNETAPAGGGSYVVKLDADGEFQWVLTTSALVTSYFNVSTNGDVFLVGVFSGTVDVNPGPDVFNLTSSGLNDIFFAKYNVVDNTFNAVKIGGTNNERIDGVTMNANKDIVLAGEFYGLLDFDPGPEITTFYGVGSGSRFLLKLDSDFSFISASLYSVPGSSLSFEDPFNAYEFITYDFELEDVKGVLVDGDDEVYIYGYMTTIPEAYHGTIFIQKIGGYSSVFTGTATSISDAEIDSEGNIYLSGSYNGVFHNWPAKPWRYNGYLAKINGSTGSLMWGKSISVEDELGLYENAGFSNVEVDAEGNVFASGFISLNADFDFDSGSEENLVSGGFFAKYNTSGEFDWVVEMPGDDSPRLSIDNSNSLWVAGLYRGTFDFDPGSGTLDFSSGQNSNGELAQAKYLLKFGVPNCASSPYSVHDPKWQQVIEEDSYCCSNSWDEICQDAYDELVEECAESPYNFDDPVYLEVIQNDLYCCNTSWDALCQYAYEDGLLDCVDSPFDTDDPIYQQVIYEYPSCCSDVWDDFCGFRYQTIQYGSIIEGAVTLNSDCNDQSAVLELYNPGSTYLAHQYTRTLFNGNFVISQGGAIGNYDVFIKVDGYLKKAIGNYSFGANNQLSFGTVTQGDLNDDNTINIVDFSTLVSYFGTIAGDPDFNALADLNCDAIVNVVDFSILTVSFGVVGDSAPLED